MDKIICTDMDRTLIFSHQVHIEAFNLAFQKNNLPKVKAKILKRELTGQTIEKIIGRILPKAPKKLKEQIKKDHKHFVTTQTYKKARVFSGVKETLRKLRKKYKIIILSNCSHQEIIQMLKGAGIKSELFSRVIGEDEVRKGKPSPQILKKAEHLMHHKPDFMIGDSVVDIQAAKKAKIKIIAVATGSYTKKQLKRYRPDYILNRFSELPKLLL